MSGSTLNLTCKPYPNNSAPSGIVADATGGTPVSPGHRHHGRAAPSRRTTRPPDDTLRRRRPPPPTTTGDRPTSVPITQAFQTLFDPNASIADKVAAIEDGASIETGLTDAFSSSLASSRAGAKHR